MLLQILNWTKLDESGRKAALARAGNNDTSVAVNVRDIVAQVRRGGDTALRELTARFDGFDGPLAFLPPEALARAADELDPTLRAALDVAIANVTRFHQAQRHQGVRIETQPGVMCELKWRPIERVGLYVPGDSAPLFSTVVMGAVPAMLAGCSTLILCTPPRKDGSVHPGILAAAHLCGVTRVLPLGGAQAIAALAFGTATVPKVDKIFGPGNAYVTMAKQLVAQEPDGAAIDMPAGPSEVMVLASTGANPAWIAADMLAQAEHGPDSQAILVTSDARLAEDVRRAVAQQQALLPRAEILARALQNSRILVVPDRGVALDVANAYAPEHLILHDPDAEALVSRVQHAGSVFVGPWSPETAGDYASGTNHVLPTYGYARAHGSLSLLSFMKSMTVQSLTQSGLAAMAPSLTALAKAEGLEAHAAAVKVRVRS